MENNIKELQEKEAKQQWDTLVNCLFCGTEHIQAGGKQQALGLIQQLIHSGYLKAEDLLCIIGRELDTYIRMQKQQ